MVPIGIFEHAVLSVSLDLAAVWRFKRRFALMAGQSGEMDVNDQTNKLDRSIYAGDY